MWRKARTSASACCPISCAGRPDHGRPPPPRNPNCWSSTQAVQRTDLNALCEATDAAIIDGGGFGWVNPPGRRALETYFRGVLLVPERELFVARLNGDIVGSAIWFARRATTRRRPSRRSLMHSYIAPYARGHGLARMLTRAVEERARELGYHILNLDVRETQTVAIADVRIRTAISAGASIPSMPWCAASRSPGCSITSGCVAKAADGMRLRRSQ